MTENARDTFRLINLLVGEVSLAVAGLCLLYALAVSI